jgi:multiple sugar transport system substrate-binding protein
VRTTRDSPVRPSVGVCGRRGAAPYGPRDAWTAAEFAQALIKLRAAGYKRPLDLKLNYGQNEWYTYGFSPIVQSAGGDLVDRSTYATPAGSLNGPPRCAP